MRLFGKFATLAGVMALSASGATAAVRPYLASGLAHFTSPNFDFAGSGIATHLGRYTETGAVSFSPTSNPAVVHVDGNNEYIAADGSKLRGVISGELNQQTGAIAATVAYAGGTGRFASAAGSSVLVGQLLPDGSISIRAGGTIDY